MQLSVQYNEAKVCSVSLGPVTAACWSRDKIREWTMIIKERSDVYFFTEVAMQFSSETKRLV